MSTPHLVTTYCIETDCLPFGMSLMNELHQVVFCRPTPWTHLVTHLVHIGTHQEIGRVLTGCPHRVNLYLGIDVSV